MKYNNLANAVLFSVLIVLILVSFFALCIGMGINPIGGMFFVLCGLLSAVVIGCVIWAVLYKILGMIRGQIWPFKRENRG